jgi:uncharacterized membrane protein
MTRSNSLWAICLLFALYTAWSGLLPATLPGFVDGLATTVLLVAFALLHGSERYGWGGILVFVVVCLLVSNAFENLSILTGFPFGHYYYSDVLGPKIFLVPALIGGAYLGAGYLSWTVAHVLLDKTGTIDRGAVWTLPLVGTVLMVSWDLTFDPSASTIAKWWIWIDGGSFFGVPFVNYLGWFLTVFLFLAPFSWYQSTRPVKERDRSFWAQAVVMYFILGARYPLIYISATENQPVTDPAGGVWMTEDIQATAALISLFTMSAFALIAWIRLTDRAKAGSPTS